jgi:hypothetical protein
VGAGEGEPVAEAEGGSPAEEIQPPDAPPAGG